nr:PREDICTED: uncharacterized protein LOC103314677 isoform X2 [Tribolium castaneum]|eukprot:XP_015837376.1 PREDICTED: uncharacterized protein LOC103314677 isoform X2 [Tribolium castaneum]
MTAHTAAGGFSVQSSIYVLILLLPMSYGTFNSHRSALSLIIPDIGTNIYIKRFLKGIARLRPVRRKYEFTWDPSKVLDFLNNWFPNTNLSLQKLTYKLITLLALITGHRVQTLSLIKLSNILKMDTKIQIRITENIKTSLVTKNEPCLQIPFFNEQPGICAALTLSDYIQRTAQIRKDVDSLFLTIKSPHKEANKQTLTHSTRHASSSAALRKGISLDVIHKTAGWSEKSQTFAKTYNLPLAAETDFAKAIMQ